MFYNRAMGESVQAKLKQKVQRYLHLRAMLVARGRSALEIAEVDRHIARIEEIMRQCGNRPAS
jgi:ribosomal protein L29